MVALKPPMRRPTSARLQRDLRDPDPFVRDTAVQVFAEALPKAVRPTLRRRLRQEKTWWVQVEIVETFGDTGTKEDLAWLVGVLRDRSLAIPVRRAAAWVLGVRRLVTTSRLLELARKSRSPALRAELSVAALRLDRDPGHVARYLRCLRQVRDAETIVSVLNVLRGVRGASGLEGDLRDALRSWTDEPIVEGTLRAVVRNVRPA